MTLEELNSLDVESATDWFRQTCGAENWCEQMTQARPFSDKQFVLNAASEIWEHKMEASDFLQAFEAHPMIGDINTLRDKYKNTQAMASNEQSGAQTASEEVLQRLHKLNQEYLQQHDFIFIIFASGKSAEEMLKALEERIENSTETEITNAAAEQIKITRLRLSKNLEEKQ